MQFRFTASTKNFCKRVLVSFLFLIVLSAQVSFAQNRGKISGRVIEATSQSSLPGASLMIVGTSIGAAADMEGRFIIPNVPEGKYEIVASFLGYEKQTISVQVTAGKTAVVDFELKESLQEMADVVVYGVLTRGQAKSYNEQKNASNIKNVVSSEQFSKFPDRNAAEALQRIPSVSITTDQGEGEMIQVRGISQQYNSVSVNGVRIPSPDPDAERGVGLDLVQASLMESIVVTKALTPDMDGDALGGSVDFVLKDAPEKPIYNFTVGAGYNQQRSEFNKWGNDVESFSGMIGQRFFDNKFGVLLASSYFRTNRGSILREYMFTSDQSDTLTQSKWTDYDVLRNRFGINIATDYVIDAGNRLRLSFNYNAYIDDEIRRQCVYTISKDTEDRETRNRREDQRLATLKFSGEHLIGQTELDYSFFWINSRERLPNRTYWTYSRANNFDGFTNEQMYDITGLETFPNLDPMLIARLRHDELLTIDGDIGGDINLAVPYKFFENETKLKFGGKLKIKSRETDNHRYNAKPQKGAQIEVAGGTYAFEDVYWNDPVVSTLPLKALAEDTTYSAYNYEASETVIAGYASSELPLTSNLSTLVGVRVEHTQNDYTVKKTQDEDEGSYTDLLPSIHFTYRFSEIMNLRLALTTGLSRPNYSALVPKYLVDDEEKTISLSNADLKPVRAKGIDLFFERYTNNLGLLSAGFFYKKINDQLTTSSTYQEINGDVYEVSQPINGGTADVYGLEFAFNQRFSTFDVGIFKPFGIYFNYTYTHSKTKYGNREMPMSASPRHISNIALFYDNYDLGLSFSINGVIRSPLINSIGENQYNDKWYDNEFRLDISASQQIYKFVSFYIQANNLTNQKEVERLGDPSESFSRLEQTEEYGFNILVGLKFEL